jgi:D-alanyl-D-alanine carboxypeptidase
MPATDPARRAPRHPRRRALAGALTATAIAVAAALSADAATGAAYAAPVRSPAPARLAAAAPAARPAAQRPAAHEAAARDRTRRLDARTRTRLNRTLHAALARTWAPGVVAGVWVGDRGWTAVDGVADRTTGAAPRPTDHTRIGSVTKTFTGTLILQLVDEGRLRLDETIDRWFPTLPNASAITIRDLGAMSSGIASYSADPSAVDRYLGRPHTTWSPDELIAAGSALPRRFAPGEGFDYSNTNFILLGEIVEQIVGKPLAQVMRDKLFAPLGMRHTSYLPVTRLPAPAWRGYTVQGSTNGAVRDATNWSPTFAGAAGQIVSTLGDLRRWTVALGSGALLKPATQRARLVPNPASRAGGRAYDFALGNARGWLMHSGELPGFNTQVAYLPQRRLAIVVLANSDVAGAGGNPAPAIFDALADVVAPGTLPRG